MHGNRADESRRLQGAVLHQPRAKAPRAELEMPLLRVQPRGLRLHGMAGRVRHRADAPQGVRAPRHRVSQRPVTSARAERRHAHGCRQSAAWAIGPASARRIRTSLCQDRLGRDANGGATNEMSRAQHVSRQRLLLAMPARRDDHFPAPLPPQSLSRHPQRTDSSSVAAREDGTTCWSRTFRAAFHRRTRTRSISRAC